MATRNGYAGFVIFHSALLLIAVSTVVRPRWSVNVVRVAFIIVTVGALGAVFRYDEVAIYRLPVIAAALAGCGGLVRAAWLKLFPASTDGG